MKALKFIKDNKIFFVTFGMLMLVSVEYLVQKEFVHFMDNFYYPLYVIDYSCGYSSRLLIGSIFSLFIDGPVNYSTIIGFMLCVYTAVCFTLSLFINNYLKSTKYEPVAVYALFMIVSPTFLSFLKYLGTLDIFWIFFVVASLWAVDKKGWRWLVPIFCSLALCIYELFVTTFLPVMAIIVFYQFVKKPNVSNFIYIAGCAVVVGLATLYFLRLGDFTMKMTSDELVTFAQSRLDEESRNFDQYYIRSVLFWETPEVENYHGFAGYIQYCYEYFIKDSNSLLSGIRFFLLSNFITAIPFVCIIIKSFRKAAKPLEKFIFLCSLSPIAFVVINLLLSTDTERFSTHFLLAILFLTLFFIKDNNTAFSDSYDELKEKLSNNKVGIGVFVIAAARTILSGVRF